MLADIINIKLWLDADQQTPYAERLQRDAHIGAELTDNQPANRVAAWWQAVGSTGGSRVSIDTGHQLEQARGLATGALVALGAVLGASVTATALTYTGDAPVNLLTLLTVLVGLPTVLLLVGLVALLPSRALPGLQRSIVGMNPGHWLSTWLEARVGLTITPASRPAWRRNARWQLVVSSQAMAIAYFAAALLTLLGLVALTDLAFGWSTTLELTAGGVHRLFGALAAPWAAWLPSAVPDATLVSDSRFFRLDGAATAPPERLGQWWPFVFMTIVVYGLLPRLALLGLGMIKRRNSYQRLLLDDTDVTALLDRLASPVVTRETETVQQNAEQFEQPDAAGLIAADATVLVWNAAAEGDHLERFLRSLGVAARSVAQAGSGQPIPTLTDADIERVVWVTKGWEPPLLEFLDAAAALRSQLGSEPTIAVAPCPLNGSEIDPDDQRIWSGALARAADPKLIVLGGGS